MRPVPSKIWSYTRDFPENDIEMGMGMRTKGEGKEEEGKSKKEWE